MTWEIMDILQWLIPSGSLGALIVWVTNRTLRNVRTAKEVHDTYKSMYEDTQAVIKEFSDENKRLYKAVSRLEKAISRASVCRHYDACPIRTELQEPRRAGANTQHRQPATQKRVRADPPASTAEQSGDSDTDAGTGDAPCGGGL